MATTEGRRSILKASAVALGAALLPRSAAAGTGTRGDGLDALRADYLRRVEALAERLRPRFEAGELHGYDEADGDGEEAAGWDRSKYNPSVFAMEEEIRAEWFPDEEDFAPAYVALACSPSEALIPGDTPINSAHGAAAECVAMDVIRIARQRRWYRPTPGEEPSNEKLGIEVRP